MPTKYKAPDEPVEAGAEFDRDACASAGQHRFEECPGITPTPPVVESPDEAALAKVRELISPQWRPIPHDVDEKDALAAFAAGRNWMIDRIREVVNK